MHDRPARPTAFCWNQKYPRVCGEKIISKLSLMCPWGSPPHMRGKEQHHPLLPEQHGITPAYAGKSSGPTRKSTTNGDHPRICGEKFRAYAKIYNEWGSPPHMRGKVLAALMPTNALRITPAYAGKSRIGCSGNTGSKDHPRVCGEKRRVASEFSGDAGKSVP